jgi:gliding motility-associated-like protein
MNFRAVSNVFIPIAMPTRWKTVRSLGLFLLLGASTALRAAVLAPPDLRCVSVGLGGEAVLTWLTPPDPTAEFLRYEVYHASALAGPYTLVANIPTYAQTTYTHVAAGANTAPQYYYLLTVSTSAPPNTSMPSDTLASIFIQVTQSVPLGSSVVDWNLPHDPPLPTSATASRIAMEYPPGTWALADSVPNTTHHWSRVVSICDDSLNFRVHLADVSGCTSSSSITGAHFQDITPPSVPQIVNVTVDTATNQAVVNWLPSPEFDTDGYIIVLVTPGGNEILDTLYGRLNTSFTWPLSAAGVSAESYTIAAIDTCWKGTPPSPNTSAASGAHTSVHLAATYDQCAGTMLLERTDYGGWPVDHYELFRQVDNGAWILLTPMGSATQYVESNIQADHQYCYVLKAVGSMAGQTALSNKVCRITAYPPVPQWNYIRTVTVGASNEVLVVDSMDTAAFTRRLLLERSYNGLPWEQIAVMPGGAGPVVTFTDADVMTTERSYTYRVQVEDSCGSLVRTSNVGNSILLNVSPDPGGLNHLRWNGYVQWAGAVSGYAVYRSVADGPFQLVGGTAPGQWEFADDVNDLYLTPGKFCYYVEAQETGNPAGIDATSASNIACTVQQGEVWVPNAFIESGINNRFKPVLAFADVQRYEFSIFNRWGQLIWTTNNPDQAWDGRVDGTVVPQGVYAWYCSIQDGNGKTVERKGTVTFIAGR